jgi:serine/threonine-protein kinase RsbT
MPDPVAPGTTPKVRVLIREEADVAIARQHVCRLARGEGFSETATASLATAASEVVRNIVVHARAGEMGLWTIEERGRRGIMLVARDDGPGIADVDRAMQDGYSTGQGLGLGLPGARRLVDDFALTSVDGEGTTVVLKKWSA